MKQYLTACKDKNLNQICSNFEITVLEGLILGDEQSVLTPEFYPVDGEGKKVVEFLDPTMIVIEGLPQTQIPRSN